MLRYPTGLRGLRHLIETPSFHVIYLSIYRDDLWRQRVGADALYGLQRAVFLVLDRMPFDEAPCRTASTVLWVGPFQRRYGERSGRQAVIQKFGHDLVVEQLHTSVGVVNDEPFQSPEKLVRDYKRPNGVVARASSRVINHMGIAF